MKRINKIFTVMIMLLLVLLTVKAAWGAVVINEIMPDPKVVDDKNGEYFELYNSGEEDVNIGGWTIKDNGGESHTINGVLTIPAEGYLTLCRNSDKTINGGIDCDYKYTGFTLGNSDDEIILTDVDDEEQDRVEYTTSFPFASGVSMELKNPSLDNNVADNWKKATSTYGLGDKGTPGKTNNDAPVISAPPAALNAVEGVKFSYTVTATDDGEQKDLSISAANSILPAWLTIDPTNKLTLIGTPQTADIGTTTITLVVSDSSALSEKKTTDLTVKPALEISEVKVKGTAVEENGKTLPVTPGEDYSVEFKVTNNFDSPISLIMSKLTDMDADDGLGFSDQEEILLGKGESKVVILSETMPNIPNSGSYSVEITTTALGFWKAYSDSFNFDLVVEKPVASVKINEIAWNGLKAGEQAKTYCNQFLDLSVDYENLGGVEAKSMKMSVIDQSGKEVASSNVNNLASGEGDSTTLSINLKDLTELSYGNTNQLSVKLDYTVNGFKMTAETLSPNPAFIPMDCFAPTTPVLTIYEGESGEVDLKEFTPSTKLETPESVTFAIKSQTNPELVGCTLDGTGKFKCDSNSDVSGESVFDIILTSGTTINEEKITVKVNPTIDITGVKVKNKVVEENKESTGIKSLEEFPLEITLTNSWKSTIKNVKFSFGTAGAALGLEDKEFSGESIAPGSSKTFSLTQKLANTAAGAPQVIISVTAEDENFKEVDDTFGFKLNIGKETGELKITKLGFKDLDNDGKANTETYCNPQLTLLASYVNSGKEPIDEITISIKDEKGNVIPIDNGKLWELGELEGYTHSISINTIKMSPGEHTLTVTFTYTYGEKEKSDSATIKLTKYGCLNIPANEFTITEDDSGIDLDLKELMISEDEQADAAAFTFSVTKQSKAELISCGIDGKVFGGILHCDWPLGTVPPNNALAAGLNDGESLTNEVEITATAKDGTKNTDKFTITVTGKNDAPEFIKEVAISFEEDKTKSVKLSDYVKDADNEAAELKIVVSDNKKVTVTKDGENLVFSAEKDWSGTEEFELTITDPKGASSETKKITVKVSPVDDTAELSEIFDEDETTSGEAVGPINVNEDHKLSLGVNNPDGTEKWVKWYVDEVVKETDKSIKDKFNAEFTFNAGGKVGEFTVKAVLVDKNGEKLYDKNGNELSKEWIITTTNLPVTSVLTTNLPASGITPAQLANFADFTVENSYGKIAFTQNVDLSKVPADLDKVISISDGLVAIDSQNTLGLKGKTATITLKKNFNKHIILKSEGFKSGSFAACPTSVCKAVSNTNGEFVFTVNGFSTYKVVEDLPAGITIAPTEFTFENVNRSTATVPSTVNTTFTVTNVGSVDSITGLTAKFTGNTKYAASAVSNKATLAPGESANVALTLTVPKDEDGGKHFVGKLQVSAANAAIQSVDVYLAPLSYLKIEDVEINGDNDGELVPGQENDFEIQVQNDYTEDIQDITVTVKIKDVDGDDLEEESKSFDLDAGDDDNIKVSFNLAGEKMDEEEYDVEITVQGEADDNSEQETTETMKVQVNREKHQVVLNSVELSTETLQCLKQATLHVNLENIGKSNEDDVEIRVKNTALGVDEKRSNIELDKFSGSDNEYSTTFEIDAENAASGNYPLTVELYRDGKQDDSASVNLEVKECLTTSTKSQQQNTYSDAQLTAQLQQQLQQQLAAKKAAEEKAKVTVSAPEKTFRDSEEYSLLLWALVVLVAIAVILELAVLAKPRRRREEK